MFNKLPHISRRKLTIGLLALDGAFFAFTDPAKIDSIFLIVGFMLLAATSYLLIIKLCALGRVYGLQFDRKSHQIAMFGTGILIGLIALQSIGELTFRDLLVAIPLGVITYMYLSYGRSSRPHAV
jgi:hypothetical protein